MCIFCAPVHLSPLLEASSILSEWTLVLKYLCYNMCSLVNLFHLDLYIPFIKKHIRQVSTWVNYSIHSTIRVIHVPGAWVYIGKNWGNAAGCVTFIWLVGDEVTGWCSRSHPSGSNQSGLPRAYERRDLIAVEILLCARSELCNFPDILSFNPNHNLVSWFYSEVY